MTELENFQTTKESRNSALLYKAMFHQLKLMLGNTVSFSVSTTSFNKFPFSS